METQDNVTVITDELAEFGEAEQVETTEQSEETEDTPPSEQEASDEPKDTEPKESHSRFQKRIDKLTKQREEAYREAEALRKELEAIKSLPKKEAVESKELNPLDFETYDDYIEAINSQPKAESKKVEKKDEATPVVDATQRKLDDAFDDARELFKDFDEVVFDDKLPFTPTMVVAFTEMDKAGEVAYYLAQHKDELKEMAKLSATKQVIELNKVAEKLANPPKAEKKVTKAPEPINPVTAQGDVVEKDPSKMSFKEYEAWRNSQTKKNGFW